MNMKYVPKASHLAKESPHDDASFAVIVRKTEKCDNMLRSLLPDLSDWFDRHTEVICTGHQMA